MIPYCINHVIFHVSWFLIQLLFVSNSNHIYVIPYYFQLKEIICEFNYYSILSTYWHIYSNLYDYFFKFQPNNNYTSTSKIPVLRSWSTYFNYILILYYLQKNEKKCNINYYITIETNNFFIWKSGELEENIPGRYPPIIFIFFSYWKISLTFDIDMF